jgi:transcriptional regulator with XRE-family HTH domain
MAKVHSYATYLFRDKDPVIDELRTMKQDAGVSDKEISETSGVSTTTLYNWFQGKTRRPQSSTTEAVGRALGKKRAWVDMSPRERREAGVKKRK